MVRAVDLAGLVEELEERFFVESESFVDSSVIANHRLRLTTTSACGGEVDGLLADVVRVLLVDDSAVARARARKSMASKGLEVVVCASASEAKAIDPSSLEAALLDLELGEDRGTDLARELRTSSPRLPIAFLTAASDSALQAEARELGPVFDKTTDFDRAIGWLVQLAETGA
jgi:CheY-like chemotaxis protein